MSRRGQARQLLAAVAGHGLAGSVATAPPPSLSSGEWRQLLRLVRTNRLYGHLVGAILSGELPVDDEQFDEAVELHTDALGHALLLEQRLLECVGALSGVNIPSRVLKGPAVAHTIYEDPSLRLFGDIDLLVPSEHVDEALDVLGTLGLERLEPSLSPRFDRHYGKSVTLLYPDRVEIDLHRTLAPGYHGLRLDPSTLFDDSWEFELGGVVLPGLGIVDAFLHACCHAMTSHVALLVPLCDIARYALRPDLDLDECLVRAKEWDAEAVVATAVRSTWDELGIADSVPLSAWASRYHVSHADERRLASYRGPRGREAFRALEVLAGGGKAKRVGFLGALLFPDRSYLDEVGYGRLAWLRRGAASLLHRGG